MAMAAAAALDDMQWSEIVGCVAGDNTVMCAIRSAEDALVVMNKLKKMLDSIET
jgi:Arginine repressor